MINIDRSTGLFDKIIDGLIEERLFNSVINEKSTEYDKREKELISLSNSIRKLISLDQNLFMKYEELSALNENDQLRDVYRQGIIDGFELFSKCHGLSLSAKCNTLI